MQLPVPVLDIGDGSLQAAGMPTLGFIGAGRMASAIVHGVLRETSLTASDILCTSAADGTGERLAEATGIGLAGEVAEVLAADVIVLAIKPQQLKELAGLEPSLSAGRLILSILAGTTLKRLTAAFPEARNVVRAMPNTPGQIGAGVSAYASAGPLAHMDRSRVEEVLGALGTVLALPEEQLDAVTAVSGSGPAYVFEFIAGLRDAGVRTGLDESTAATLAMETVRGAALLLQQSGAELEELRIAVTSPGGTTAAGLAVLAEKDFRGMLAETVAAAQKRSRELAQA